MAAEPVLIAGGWRKASSHFTFTAENPSTGKKLKADFPISEWQDCDATLTAAVDAAKTLRSVSGEHLAIFLEGYARRIEERISDLVEIAHTETALPITPRLKDVEIPRTTTQLRQGATAAREGSWAHPIIDTKANIRSHFAPIGPVVIFGPNNFPFAFNGIAGGDFTAAIASGNPVIAKAHPLQPGTSKLLAECAVAALVESCLPTATVQMIYHLSNEDGLRLVSDPRIGATSFTGSRAGGLHLKAAAEKAGKVIYLEMSSLNPVILLPGALKERGEKLASELADSCLAASGQFCTSPNLILVIAGGDAEQLSSNLAGMFEKRPSVPLLSSAGLKGLDAGVKSLIRAGATLVTGAEPVAGEGYRYQNTLLRISAERFFDSPEELQQEAFGNATLLIAANDIAQLQHVIEKLEGNLTGSIYSSTTGEDDAIYPKLATALRYRVGRLLNDKMPTGVALSPAMNHGGPFPATGHPGFTAVGIPASMVRFCALHCYDNVRPARLPDILQDQAPNPSIWRLIDGTWTRG